MDLDPTEQRVEDRYDDAMFDFTMEQYDDAIGKLEAILAEFPDHFDARLALGMAWYRKGDFARAIAEGHRAEKLRPQEQLVHTNLSLFYMKSGDKKTAEHHGLQARIASWRGNMDQPAAPAPGTTAGAADPDSELRMAEAPPAPVKAPTQFPDMPWKRKTPPPAAASPAGASAPTGKTTPDSPSR